MRPFIAVILRLLPWWTHAAIFVIVSAIHLIDSGKKPLKNTLCRLVAVNESLHGIFRTHSSNNSDGKLVPDFFYLYSHWQNFGINSIALNGAGLKAPKILRKSTF